MSGTSLVMPDALIAQSSVIASQWTPETVAPLLVEEFIMDGGQTPSLINRATPSSSGTIVLSGTSVAPTFDAHDMVVTSNGIDTGVVPSEVDQTYCCILKTPTANGSVYAAAGFTGLIYGATTGKFGFYNSGSGAGAAAEVSPVAGTDFQCVFGWGSKGGLASIQTASAGALNAIAQGTVAGGNRPTTTNRIGTTVFNTPDFIVAAALRVPAILTAAQRLAWYLSLRQALAVTVS